MSTLEIFGIVIISIINLLANAGGLGGGGSMIPFLMIFLGLPIKECVPLANFFGLLSGTTRFIAHYKKRHPNNP